ncbi:dynamin family protein [Desulfurobacterium sp.]
MVPYSKLLTKELEKLLDEISAYRDINNDFPDRNFNNELSELERTALQLFKLLLLKQENQGRVNVVVLGNFSSGKSSLINCLLGKKICPTKVNPTTSSVTRFIYGQKPEIFLLKDTYKKPITQEEYIKLTQHNIKSTEKTRSFFFEYRYPSELLKNIALYDTPGFENPKNPNDEKITEEVFLEEADIVLFVQDTSKPSLEESTLNRIKKLKKLKENAQWYLLLNKADQLNKKDKKRIEEFWKASENAKLFKKIFFYSAKEITEILKRNKSLEFIKNSLIRKISSITLTDNEISVLIEAHVNEEGKFKKRKKIDFKCIYSKNDSEESLEEQISILSEKKKQFYREHLKLIKALEKIAEEKERTINRKIDAIKMAYSRKKKKLIPKILNSIKPEMFENFKNIQEVTEELERAINSYSPFKTINTNINQIDVEKARKLFETYIYELVKFTEHTLKSRNLNTDFLENIKEESIRHFNHTIEKNEDNKISIYDLKMAIHFIKLTIIHSIKNQLILLKDKAESKKEEVIEKISKITIEEGTNVK